MALSKVNESEVVSSDGFKVKYGKDTLTYSEVSRYVQVPIEHLGSPYEMRVCFGLVRQWMAKGLSGESISHEERELVVRRISEALRFLGRNFSIEN